MRDVGCQSLTWFKEFGTKLCHLLRQLHQDPCAGHFGGGWISRSRLFDVHFYTSSCTSHWQFPEIGQPSVKVLLFMSVPKSFLVMHTLGIMLWQHFEISNSPPVTVYSHMSVPSYLIACTKSFVSSPVKVCFTYWFPLTCICSGAMGTGAFARALCAKSWMLRYQSSVSKSDPSDMHASRRNFDFSPDDISNIKPF